MHGLTVQAPTRFEIQEQTIAIGRDETLTLLVPMCMVERIPENY